MTNSYIALFHKLMSLSFIVLTAHFSTAVEATNRDKLALRLIHRDSILLSPYSQTNNGLRAPLVPYRRGIFLVNISIGEPPIPQLLAMDTGSPLTWFHSQSPSTCKKVSCNSNYQCQDYFDSTDCELQESRCTYDITYMDGSYCKGIIASEKFTFATSDGGTSVVPDVLFGCGLEAHGTLQKINGILGLEFVNQYSLVSRVGKKFSYCIGNISDPYYMYNQLVLGEGAVIEGYSTPLETREDHYVVSMKGISVGDKQLEIDEKDFHNNVVIDSGTTLTCLHRSAYKALKEEVVTMLDGLIDPIIIEASGERPCYSGDLVRDLKGFPMVSLHLDGETDLSLDIEGMFQRIGEGVFCMAVVAVEEGDMNIIGALAQQYYNVGFDLNEKKVSFLNIDCELLED